MLLEEVKKLSVDTGEKITALVLHRGNMTDDSTVDKLVKEIAKKNVPVYAISLDTAYITNTNENEKLTIHNYDGTNVKLTIHPKQTICFARKSVLDNQSFMSIVSALEYSGVFVLNSLDSTKIASNKLTTMMLLKRGGLPIPKTSLISNLDSLDVALKEVGKKFPIIVKTLTGSKGVGVVKADSYNSLVSILQILLKNESDILLQEMLNLDYDIRILVLDGKILAAMKRSKATGDFRTNISQGGEGTPYELNDEQREIARKAARLIDGYYVGVDLAVTKDGKYYVLEVNGSPGSGGSYKTEDGKDINGKQLINKVVTYALDKNNWHVYDKTTFGLIEYVYIDGVGELKAKLDTGNGSVNSIHATNIEVNKNETSVKFKLGDDKEFELPLVDWKKIHLGGGHKNERPIVELDIMFNGKEYKKVLFNLCDRSDNIYPILIGKKFLREIGAVVDVSTNFIAKNNQTE